MAATAAFAVDDSPISSPRFSSENGPTAIAAARERGAATAGKDIEAGKFRILYFGIPWSAGKPLIDDATGYRVEIVEGCTVGSLFVAEVEAYNDAMRAFHEKSRPSSAPKP